MAVRTALAKLTLDEFFELEAAAEVKHELFAGAIYAMSGAGYPHCVITPMLAKICLNGVSGKCRFFDQDTEIVVAATGSSFYSDGGIACSPHFVNPSSGAVDNPSVIFEVVSVSRKSRDRDDKFWQYPLLPSVQDYVLISTEIPRVEDFSRQSDGGWFLDAFLAGSSAFIPSVNLEIPLDRLYADVNFEAPTDANDVAG